jgi:hypothetical protein
LQILVAHFDDLRAGALKHALSFVDLLDEATALPDCWNHRLSIISPYRYSSARVRAGESNGFFSGQTNYPHVQHNESVNGARRRAAIIRADGRRRLSLLPSNSRLRNVCLILI